MPEYGFSVTFVFPYKVRIEDHTGKYGSGKTRILAYFSQCRLTYSDEMFYIHDFQKQSPDRVCRKVFLKNLAKFREEQLMKEKLIIYKPAH